MVMVRHRRKPLTFGEEKTPDEIIRMKPVLVEDNSAYGFGLFNAYHRSFYGHDLPILFKHGATGMVFGEEKPSTMDHLRSELSHGDHSLPRDHYGKDLPALSGGQYAECWANMNHARGNRRFLRLQGDFEELCESTEKEGVGGIAVAVLNTLAINSYVPNTDGDGKRLYFIQRLALAAMSPDDRHDDPWVGFEIDIHVAKGAKAFMPIPYDPKTMRLVDLGHILSAREEVPA